MSLPNLLGTWVMELVLASQVHVPVLRPLHSETRSVLAVRIEARGGQLWQTQQVCDARITEEQRLVRTVLPRAFVAALPLARFPVTTWSSDGAWYYAADFGRQAVGWSGVGALPGSPDDPAVVDSDGDGRPGVTVLVEAPLVGAGEVWVAQAGRTTARGRIEGDRVQGQLEVPELEQRVLGASNRLLLHAPQIEPDPAASRFEMRRVDDAGCAAALRAVGGVGAGG